MPPAPAAGPGTASREKLRGGSRSLPRLTSLPSWATVVPMGQAEGPNLQGGKPNRWRESGGKDSVLP